MGIRESRLIQWAYEQVMRHEREKESKAETVMEVQRSAKDRKLLQKIADESEPQWIDPRVGNGHWMSQDNVCEGMGSKPTAKGRCKQCLRTDVKVTKKGKLFRHKNVMK